MTFLSIKDSTYEALKLFRLKGEGDDALVQRIIELARARATIRRSPPGQA